MDKSPATLFQKSGAGRKSISVVSGVEQGDAEWLVVGNEEFVQSASFFLGCAGNLVGLYLLPSVNPQNRDWDLVLCVQSVHGVRWAHRAL